MRARFSSYSYGKAHPRDEGGKALIKSIFDSAKDLEQDIPVAFLEDYSMATGLAMTGGVDIWLNNPIRPMEASGTSGNSFRNEWSS